MLPPPPPPPPVTAAADAASPASGPPLPPPPPPPPRRCPVVLCPGLGSSGAYTFDLSPVVSLADYLASRGWDVWTVELRGNGQSDRPRLFVRSRWWTIDDYVTKDLPAVLSYVRRVSGAARAHVLGHSMGGMILTRLLALGGEPAESVASATVVGSGCFLRGSWWQALEHTLWLARFLWLVPAGATLRAYSPLALGRAGVSAVDQLYFWPPNTDPVLARAVLARNFSAISSGVILQFASAFGPRGLHTADGREAFADPGRLGRVETPVMFVCGDRDRMCPPQGAAATCALFTGSRCARYVELGPRSRSRKTRHHYGHFDILMGRHAETEVFPLLAGWLEEHDAGSGGSGSGGGIHSGNDSDAGAKAAPAAAHLPGRCQGLGDPGTAPAPALHGDAAALPLAPMQQAADEQSRRKAHGGAPPGAPSGASAAMVAAAPSAQPTGNGEAPAAGSGAERPAAGRSAGVGGGEGISDGGNVSGGDGDSGGGGADQCLRITAAPSEPSASASSDDGGGGRDAGGRGGDNTGSTTSIARNAVRAYERYQQHQQQPAAPPAPGPLQAGGYAPWGFEPAVMLRSRL